MNGEHTYQQQDFAGEKSPCDIILKGGIASGVVYPLAILELARRFRFANVGGTSVGAIAAAITAAAEHGRNAGGFIALSGIPNKISHDLLKLFQPRPELRPLFQILMAAVSDPRHRILRILRAIIRGYPLWAVHGALLGVLVLVIAYTVGSVSLGLLGVFLSIVGSILSLGLRLAYAVLRELPENGFGLCPGTQQAGFTHQGLTDWLADVIDEAAGLVPLGAQPGRPLTFGDLAGADIGLAMVTTNLSMRRPHQLPFRDRRFCFRRSEFERLFPNRVVAHLIANTDTYPRGRPQLEDYYYLTEPQQLPVVVAARMSLSFPLLFEAVPLYTRDFTLAQAERQTLRRCWFSDGGLSSNFPIHFFDRLWPNSPTFGINLEEYDPKRHGETHVWMPRTSQSGLLLPILDVRGLSGFLMSLIYAAKDWQDNLQSSLSGYRERIVHIALSEDEGGLNLAMSPETIERLTAFGAEAGESLTHFDLDEHRWRRFLIAMARLEEAFDELATSHDTVHLGGEAFGPFLARYPAAAGSYKPVSPEWLESALARANELVQLGRQWRAEPRIQNGAIPKPATDLRIQPKT